VKLYREKGINQYHCIAICGVDMDFLAQMGSLTAVTFVVASDVMGDWNGDGH
jgi:hypothetical protein